MTCTSTDLVCDLLEESSFAGLADEWDELLNRSFDNRIFYTTTWHRIWREFFSSDETHLVTARNRQGKLTGLLPLQVVPHDGRSVLGLTGDYNVMDYMDGLAVAHRAREVLGEMWQYALDHLHWDTLELRHVPSASPLLGSLQDIAGEPVTIEDDEVCPVALLCNSWDGYLQMLSKKQRHEIRRKLRRAQDGATWDWRTAQSEPELETDMAVFFRLHELSGREKARFMTPHMREFFRAMARAFLREGILRLSVFRREGVDVAATLAFLYRDRYLLYNSGYDPEYSAFSPGIASVSHAMQAAIGEGAVAFDFLSGDEPYKYQFGASNTRTCRATLQS